MPTLETVLTVAAAGLALSVTPGPSMLYVFSRSVGQSRAAGLASAVGLALGGIFLAVATALGLAMVFATYQWLEIALTYLGSLYLLWLGLSLFYSAKEQAATYFAADKIRRDPISSIIWQGFLVEALNPKTVLFFALFIPPFIEFGTGSASSGITRQQLLILGILVPLTAVPADIVVAFFGSTMAKLVNQSKKTRIILAKTCGSVLIFIAANIHLQWI